ncbi:hypothetical protein [Adhaeribacter soli]|uniref:STAS/SEC14 domain-containing protein n=1 Tax=Adhaeribacter soli TaxID=2607655 RepID=A0A5N1J4N3_9BACT|nr:hypothetical protein [Adhaeribacter soli]KAA9345861.1 hypothetical protein F0P94_01905 [Adhaeribacter soli]
MAPKFSFNLPYTLTFENKPGYLLAKVSGEADSLEIPRQFWKEITAEVDKRKPMSLLVWEDFQTMVSTQELFTLVSELCEYKQFQGLRVAFVDEHFEQLNRNKLGEMIATNRGFTCWVCARLEEAEQWLQNS